MTTDFVGQHSSITIRKPALRILLAYHSFFYDNVIFSSACSVNTPDTLYKK